MRGLARRLLGAVFIVSCLLLVACAAFGPQFAVPDDVPLRWTSNDNPAYADAVSQANQLVEARRADLNVPSFSAAVAVDGEVVWAGAAGWADIAARVIATPATTYRIGSTSKAVTVSATARLLDQGIVDLDAPISTYVEGLPEKWRLLTLRQLHSHTAGLPGYENNRDLLGLLDSFTLWKRYEDVADSLAQFDDAPLLFDPGADFYYSSFDIVLASAVLQTAYGKPFLDLIRAEVLAPTRMTSTDADHNPDVSGYRAAFYARSGARFHPWRKVDLSSKLAAGGFVSTPSDLVRLGAAYLHGDFLRKETVETLWTPQALSDGTINEQSYALGWRSQKKRSDWFGDDLWIVHHGGISKGSMSWLVVYPEIDIVIALNINARVEEFSDFSKASAQLAEIFYAAKTGQLGQ